MFSSAVLIAHHVRYQQKKGLQQLSRKDCLVVTGGMGFIGTDLIKSINQSYSRVLVIDSMLEQVHGTSHPTPNEQQREFEFYNVDIRDSAALRPILNSIRGMDFDFVHLAAETGTHQSLTNITQCFDTNVVGLATILDLFSECEIVPRVVVLTSSRAVYGEGNWESPSSRDVPALPRIAADLDLSTWEPLTSDGRGLQPVGVKAGDTPINPTSLYGVSKYTQEMILSTWSSLRGVPLQILRLQNVYGPGQSLRNPYTGVLMHFHKNSRSLLANEVFEGGGIVRDFVHVRTVVGAIADSLDNTSVSREIKDVGSGTPTTLLDAARVIAQIYDAPEPFVSSQYRPGDVRAIYSSVGFVDDEPTFQAVQREIADWIDTQL